MKDEDLKRMAEMVADILWARYEAELNKFSSITAEAFLNTPFYGSQEAAKNEIQKISLAEKEG